MAFKLFLAIAITLLLSCSAALFVYGFASSADPEPVCGGSESSGDTPDSKSGLQQPGSGPGADFRCKCLCPASSAPTESGNGTSSKSSSSNDLMAIYLYGSYSGSDICLRKVPLASLGGPFANVENQDALNGVSIYGDGKSLYAVTNLMKFHKDRTRAREMGLLGSNVELPNRQKTGPRLLLPGSSDLYQIEDKSTQTELLHLDNYEKYLEEYEKYLALNPNALMVRSTEMAPHNSFRPEDEDPSRNLTTTGEVVNRVLRDVSVHIIWLCITVIVAVTTVVLRWPRVPKTDPNAASIAPAALPTQKGAVTLENGALQIGKIIFHPKEIIGRGCSGTCVYKGLFEGTTQVAVKRVVADYVVLADREIELLRSLTHPNLIRYFATEGDEQFRYIAIELAELTLSEYIDFRAMLNYELDPIKVLHESALGVRHLHSLNVIHRDLKPHNILISQPQAPDGRRKVMISDFGVSKVVNETSMVSSNIFSLSLMGTEGWIAPELLRSRLDKKKRINGSVSESGEEINSNESQETGKLSEGSEYKLSKSADIFSLGCIFYYVLTNGTHPFGDVLSRQANILKGTHDISLVAGEENILKSNLLTTMLDEDPTQRPPIEAIVVYPLFWDESAVLQFLQDASDRNETESWDSPLLKRLEFGHFDVVKGDWRKYLTADLQDDLRRYRTYRGSSVRDLMRALRNKKHHYRELPHGVQESLGSIPKEFVIYFTSRYPRLLLHVYWAMQLVKCEDLFAPCYSQKPIYEWPVLPKSGLKWFSEETNALLEQFASVGVGSRSSLMGDDEERKSQAGLGDTTVSDIADDEPELVLKPNGSPHKKPVPLNGPILFSNRENIQNNDDWNLMGGAGHNHDRAGRQPASSGGGFQKNKRQMIKQRRAAARGQPLPASILGGLNNSPSQAQQQQPPLTSDKSFNSSRDAAPDLLPAFSRF